MNIRICLLCILLCKCSPDNDKDFIPGTYVREVHNEFSIGRDTLIISHFNETNFSIIHCGVYRRIQDGRLLPQRAVHENWSAVYDHDTRTLQETKKGRVFSFNSGKSLLKEGGSLYKKVR